MSETRIKIDLSQGLIEAEGNETFVVSIYEDFKEQIRTTKSKSFGISKDEIKGTLPKLESKAVSKQRKRKANVGTPVMVKELNLDG